jgi:hypothetical protein
MDGAYTSFSLQIVCRTRMILFKFIVVKCLNHTVNVRDFKPIEYDNGTDYVQEPWGRFLSTVDVTFKVSRVV